MTSANDIAEVILARSGPWTDAMRLQKLLYYVHAWHLAVTDEALFPERFKAYVDGPVIPQVWHLRKERSTRSASNQDPHAVPIDELTSNLIDLVLVSYGSMSGEELSALTHVELPWLEARGDLPADAPSSEPLSNDSIAAFFRAHRRLGGRAAADLAAGGVIVRDAHSEGGRVDVDAIFASLDAELLAAGDSHWGSANVPQDPRFLVAPSQEMSARYFLAG